MNKKLKIILTCVILILLILVFFLIVDYNRIINNKNPLFCVKTVMHEDKEVKEYFGLGYKIIVFDMTNGYNKVEVGNIFLKYDDFEEEIERYKFEKMLNEATEEIEALTNNHSINKNY